MAEVVKYTAVGRRKESVARVELMPGKGIFKVNKKPYEKYFLRETDRIIVKQPLNITNNINKYDVVANIKGGGLTGQASALRLGISRALLTIDPVFKDLLRKQGFLTRDSRAKERKKYGQKGARKRFQWTKR
ncbi:MAG: 30S ribosomal protein S9 [Candidatus Omnitrophica bacterium CG23_combo_of_CG06-09_8_20_14_all_41_10]|uniref:Small ribosomal subunit protein uS9 n=1 Tax=Candidatus Sherwoodlollariibacterium unditelluris TaxID=1974757 RepID=A0A2G9YKQ5_9BACT|nr:MAG: 30S ribosomal protein S9 [Candidatus Omnitrophica bacterium CG23_combo_of_CG06-09_8_20_14_all_41_10]